MNKYIDAEKLIKEIELQFRSIENATGDFAEGRRLELENLRKLITSLQQEQDSISEQFAKIVRGNITEIGKDAQKQFEQLYFEITGTKMYGGYND